MLRLFPSRPLTTIFPLHHVLPRQHPRRLAVPITLNRSATTMTITEPEWKRISDPSALPYYVFTKAIRKSEQDDREYRVIKLENGLEAMLVHDGKADKAAASLDVAVGHLYDPVSGCRDFPLSTYSTWITPRMICLDWPIFASTCCSWYVLIKIIGSCSYMIISYFRARTCIPERMNTRR